MSRVIIQPTDSIASRASNPEDPLYNLGNRINNRADPIVGNLLDRIRNPEDPLYKLPQEMKHELESYARRW